MSLLIGDVVTALVALGETPDDAAYMAESVRRQPFLTPRRYVTRDWRIAIIRRVGIVPDENAVPPDEFSIVIHEARKPASIPTSGDSED